MGEPIDIADIWVGDRVRVKNPVDDMTFTVTEITPRADGFRFIHGGTPRIFGGRLGEDPPYNQFFLIERPSRKNARALSELAVMKGLPPDLVEHELGPMLGLKKKTGKGRRATRRRKTRKSRR